MAKMTCRRVENIKRCTDLAEVDDVILLNRRNTADTAEVKPAIPDKP
jgi:hypothetical protein